MSSTTTLVSTPANTESDLTPSSFVELLATSNSNIDPLARQLSVRNSISPRVALIAAAYADRDLSRLEVTTIWDDPPVRLNDDFSRMETVETIFVAACVRIKVHFLHAYNEPLCRGSRVDIFDLDPETVRFFALYTQYMGRTRAFVRLGAYTKDGFRLSGLDIILDLPRHLNDTLFPRSLAFQAIRSLQVAPTEHPFIQETAIFDIIHPLTEIDESELAEG